MRKTGSDESLRCSFCHKSQDVVGKLISSPNDYPRAYICDECIAVCNSILEDDKPEPAAAAAGRIPKDDPVVSRRILRAAASAAPETRARRR